MLAIEIFVPAAACCSLCASRRRPRRRGCWCVQAHSRA